MTEVNKTAFSLENYTVSEFYFKAQSSKDAPITVNFVPSGRFFPKTMRYEVTVRVTCGIAGENENFISATVIANFLFNTPITKETIPDFFFVNSIAIVFPYIRAFISTLSLQSGGGLVIIPVLNLSNLEKPLKESTVVVE